MKIRKAAIEDIKDISRIHALSWKFAYRGIIPQTYLDELKEDFWVTPFEIWLNNNILTVLVMIEESSIIGCTAYGKSRDKSLSDWGEIISIYLLPEYYNKGYGSKLLESAVQDLKQSGFKNIYLWVLKENLRARYFYEKNNWKCNKNEYICEIGGKQLIEISYIYSFDNII
ncbi:GNAT family N-acetyltransferase [Anaerosphaera multitolerans]|uniref:GNAT family N-acetyltransferase n=1 Tax=Anaerosphaera multitolerans TaxID=2487351 RepID=A0A437S687_9FIRM|nr:GNAT family N-acetyltransferase [Anaerosphaera multitolerans]RVU54531.1 GNAT family N-acetyltransferase [Anaerosphaera multitolerans]